MSQKIKLRKIPLLNFLNILNTIYEKGGDFFDIEGTIDTDNYEDVVRILTLPEYFTKEKDWKVLPKHKEINEEEDDDEDELDEIPPGTNEDDLEALT